MEMLVVAEATAAAVATTAPGAVALAVVKAPDEAAATVGVRVVSAVVAAAVVK